MNNDDLISRSSLKMLIEQFQIINPKLSVYDVLNIIDNAPTYKSPCDYCIELECENHGVVCPHYRAYMREADK